MMIQWGIARTQGPSSTAKYFPKVHKSEITMKYVVVFQLFW